MKSIIVTIRYPDSVSLKEIKEYAQEALEFWGGQRHPDDNLFFTVRAPKKLMKPEKSK